MEANKKAPAFQFYPQDFISSLDVQLMSAAEVGAYCLLLFNSWTQPRQAYLPNDETQLRHISRLSPEEWKASKKKLLAKFPLTDDKKHRYNPRLASEAEKQNQFRSKQAENGKRGGRPRREGTQEGDAFLGETQNNPSLSQALEVAKPKKALPSSTSFSTSSSTSEEDSLRSSGASAGVPEKKIGGEVESKEDLLAAQTPTPTPPVAVAPLAPRLTTYRDYDAPGWPEQLNPPFETPAFHTAWAKWGKYLAELGKPHRGHISEDEDLAELRRMAGTDHARALEIISKSISASWKRLIDHKETPLTHGTNRRNHAGGGAAADPANRHALPGRVSFAKDAA